MAFSLLEKCIFFSLITTNLSPFYTAQNKNWSGDLLSCLCLCCGWLFVKNQVLSIRYRLMLNFIFLPISWYAWYLERVQFSAVSHIRICHQVAFLLKLNLSNAFSYVSLTVGPVYTKQKENQSYTLYTLMMIPWCVSCFATAAVFVCTSEIFGGIPL